MPAGKDNFHINANKYVKSANFSLGLGNDTYVTAFQERLHFQKYFLQLLKPYKILNKPLKKLSKVRSSQSFCAANI